MSNNADWLNWPQTQALVKCFAPGTLRFVGGCVRDRLLGKTVTDVDAATALTPDATTAALQACGHKAVPTGIAHGTVTAVIEGKPFEVTTLRADTACDGRHAEVAFTTDWQEDARRRDFTMNALYLSPQGELFDYFGGADDAKAGRVRFIGMPGDRISEDYLRILRFFRFHAHYGKGQADKMALAACAKGREGIARLSGERIRHEMLKLLSASQSYPALMLMQETGVLGQVFPAAPSLVLLQSMESLPADFAADALLKLAALLRTLEDVAAVEKLTERWKLSTAESKRLQRLVKEPVLAKDASEAEQKKQLRRLGAADFTDLVTLSAARNGNAPTYAAMRNLAQSWAIPEFPVRGADLKKHGMEEGEALGRTLSQMESRWEESGYQLTREELLARLKP